MDYVSHFLRSLGGRKLNSNDLIEVKFYDFLVKDNQDNTSNCHTDDRFYKFMIDCTKKLDIVPEVIYFGSMAEGFSLVDNKRFLDEIELLYPNTAIELVCEACVSASAVIIEFYRSKYSSALIFLLETQGELYQIGLNIVGLAQGDTGFKVREGVACLYLEKSAPDVISNDSILITGCSLLSQSAGLGGTTRYLTAIAERIKRLCPNNSSRIVSVGMLGQWSEQIEKGLNILLPDKLHSDKWLESIEHMRGHLFSVKPVADLKRYGKDNDWTGLTVLSIGFGGRFGIVKFSRLADIDDTNLGFDTERNCVEFNYEHDYGLWQSIIDEYVITNDKKRFQSQLTETLKCISRNTSNNYYKWRIKEIAL